MKNLVLSLLALGVFTSQSYAACMGPFCYDDTGAYISGNLFDGNGDGTPQLTKTQVAAATPRTKGQEIFCTNCTNFNNTGSTSFGVVCMSTGTTQGSYMAISSATTVTACQ